MLSKIICVLFFSLCYLTSGYGGNPEEYNFTLDMIRSLHYCQWAFVYEGKGGNSRATIMYDVLSANYKLNQAKYNLLRYENSFNQKVKEIAEGMFEGIDGLLKRNQRILAVVNKAVDPEQFSSKEVQDEIEEARLQKENGLRKIRDSATKLNYLIFDPADSKLTRMIRFRIEKEQRLKLLKKLNLLFEGMFKWQAFNVTLAEDEVRCDRDINNWLIFDLNRLRDCFTVETYEEALARGLMKDFD